MEDSKPSEVPRTSSLRWQILRQALRARKSGTEEQSQPNIDRISRKAKNGFNLIPFEIVDQDCASSSSNLNRSIDACFCYKLPHPTAPSLLLFQRRESANINDFEVCNQHNIDNTGLVCQWPSEDVLAYYCLSHADMFRSKRVIELGSGYGLAGLVIATVTEASEVVISDGNPQVVDYIQRNVAVNAGAFGDTIVKPMILHWNQDLSTFSSSFDIIIGSDCTFFKEFHKALVQTVNLLLKSSPHSEAIFFCPKRGDSLDKFLEEIKAHDLHLTLSENYDADVWRCHNEFTNHNQSWPNYEKDHCYPLLLRITQKSTLKT